MEQWIVCSHNRLIHNFWCSVIWTVGDSVKYSWKKNTRKIITRFHNLVFSTSNTFFFHPIDECFHFIWRINEKNLKAINFQEKKIDIKSKKMAMETAWEMTTELLLKVVIRIQNDHPDWNSAWFFFSTGRIDRNGRITMIQQSLINDQSDLRLVIGRSEFFLSIRDWLLSLQLVYVRRVFIPRSNCHIPCERMQTLFYLIFAFTTADSLSSK